MGTHTTFSGQADLQAASLFSVCPKNTLLAKKSTERGEVACLGAAGSRQQQAI